MTNQTILNWIKGNKDKKLETEMKDELLKKSWKLEDINDALDVAYGRKNESRKKKKSKFKSCLIISALVLLGLFIILFILGAIFGQGIPSLDNKKTPTNESPSTISGKTSFKNAKVELFLNNEFVKEVEANSIGGFKFENVEFKEGENVIKLSATNDEGKTRTTSDIKIVYDKTPPALEVTQPQTPTETEKTKIEGKSEENLKVVLKKNDKEIARKKVKNDNFLFEDVPLDAGENNFVLSVIDKAGNNNTKELVVIYSPKEQTAQVQEKNEEKETDVNKEVNEVDVNKETDVDKEADEANVDKETDEIDVTKEEDEEIKLSINRSTHDDEVSSSQIEVKGKVEPQDTEVTINGNKAGVASDGSFGMMIDLDEGENDIKIVAKKGELESSESIKVERKLNQEELNEKLKIEAQTIPYKDLFRNIDQHKGTKVYYKGEVIQVMGDTFPVMRINITQGEYGIWEDTVMVTNFDLDSSKILEDDIIKFWGSVSGEESYESVLGQTITLPGITATIVEVVE